MSRRHAAPASVNHARATGVAAVAVLTLLVCAWLSLGCGDKPLAQSGQHAQSGQRLESGAAVFADLNGDHRPEEILVEQPSDRLTIRDGNDTYRSRERWRIFEASLSDTDHDGLLEVVALVDDTEGRHLGLFAYKGGEYRERLVTSVLIPRPLSLRVITQTPVGDLVVLKEESSTSPEGFVTATYRWNGFGFTALQQTTP